MQTLLVIDDEPNIVFSTTECLSTRELTVVSAANGRQGIRQVEQVRPDAVLLDYRLPDMSGLEAFAEIRKIDQRIPVILITAYAKTETAIEAMSQGAFEYLVKPVDLSRLKQVVAKALEVSRLSRVPAILDAPELDDTTSDPIVGNSPVMQEVYKAIGRAAPQDSVVLILGESGCGKELVARAIYHYSRRQDRPFLAVNCAALPETLLESELFGHEKGAFTGADHRRIGKFEQMDGGTIFLDEIGDMSPATQAKALRLLQEQSFERVGGNTTVKTDVRIIAATNQDLQTAIEEGRFRQDLYYRLNGFTIRLPPLRERKEDLPQLCEHFLKRANHDLHKHVRLITEEAREEIAAYDWPGNVRQLQSALHFAVVHATGDVITVDCLPHEVRAGGEGRGPVTSSTVAWDARQRLQELLADGQGDIYRRLTAELDELVVTQVLEHTHGNQAQAAELLGISRMTLRSKLRSLKDPQGE